LLLFFRASSWELTRLAGIWQRAVAGSGLLYREGSLCVLVGDGTKEAKQGRKMPGVKKMRQESGDGAKRPFFFGLMYGAVGVLTERAGKVFCTPISIRVHDGVSAIRKWEDARHESASHVVQATWCK